MNNKLFIILLFRFLPSFLILNEYFLYIVFIVILFFMHQIFYDYLKNIYVKHVLN